MKNIQTLKNLLKGIQQAKKILKDFKPDMVIGTGGYVCGPIVRAAHKLGIKTYIHEQNALPGLTNKLLEKHADKVFISFEESRKYFKDQTKVILSGNPIRKDFLFSSIINSREKFGIRETDFVLLCFGGSLGAEKINDAMVSSLGKIGAEPDIKLFFITGSKHFEKIHEAALALEGDAGNRITILAYTNAMPDYLSAADLVISRAGALTVSEINACGKASILIPSPNVVDNHQYYNAKVVADAGGAILLEEKELSDLKLFDLIMRLKNNKAMLNKMSDASEKIGKTDATEIIYENLDK
jgi:UDP-N-acetylglucosamine--N-acetylmuramyl-(pentapeptide) pyrophosphoryl-undecaprenol N-acetylglucosamine transferase